MGARSKAGLVLLGLTLVAWSGLCGLPDVPLPTFPDAPPSPDAPPLATPDAAVPDAGPPDASP